MTRLATKTISVASTLAALLFASGLATAGNSSHQKTIGRTTQPIGHYEYCKKYKRDCSIRSSPRKPMQLTRKRWQQMVAVNLHANRSVAPITDLEYYKREEYWAYPKNYGDCEDYVLLKRKLLMENGWPASDLLITVVTLPNGDGHAVLTVRTDRADYALDNLKDKILPWNRTGYRFLKRQSSQHSGKWEVIEDRKRQLVGAIKR